ncbi:MAG: flotillin-like FloA family protein [Dehalococcoidales bacterium]
MFKVTGQILAAIDDPLQVGVIIIAGIMVLIFLLLVLKYGGVWLQAKLTGADVSVPELIGMTLRKVNARTIVVSRIVAVQAGLSVSTRQLEIHYLAGGRVQNVVNALVRAKQTNVDLSFEAAAAIDLAGRDVLAEVQACQESSPISPVDSDDSIRTAQVQADKDHIENLRAGREQAT